MSSFVERRERRVEPLAQRDETLGIVRGRDRAPRRRAGRVAERAQASGCIGVERGARRGRFRAGYGLQQTPQKIGMRIATAEVVLLVWIGRQIVQLRLRQ